MATKDEYYQRIIASLQADISSQNKAISDLKSTIDRQQKEIVALKVTQKPQQSSEPQQERISTEHLLSGVKRVCDDVIRANYEQLTKNPLHHCAAGLSQVKPHSESKTSSKT